MAAGLRFSLSALIAVVVVICVYLAALRHGSQSSAQGAVTLTVALFACGLFWAVFRPKADRLFWAGFQICGWAYLLLAFVDWSQPPLGSRLLTTRLAAWTHARMPSAYDRPVMVEWHGTWFPATVLSRDGPRFYINYTGYDSNWDEWVGLDRIRGQFTPFLNVCHALIALAVALAGGVMIRLFRDGSARWFPIALGVCTAIVVPAGLVGLFRAVELAASAAVSLTAVSVLLAALAAIAARDAQRRFALGFALLGAGYFALHLADSLAPHLLTTRVVDYAVERLHPTQQPISGAPYSFTTTYQPFVTLDRAPASGANMRVYALSAVANPAAAAAGTATVSAHCLLAILLSLAGGLAALLLSRSGVTPGDALIPDM
jgi:hypothetical protein